MQDRLVAHRGYPSRYPENTSIGIEAALEAGARWVEVDVQLSADRRPVLFHDRNLRRVCGVSGAVHDRTLAELRELRASDRASFGRKFEDVRLTTLEQFRDLLARYPAVETFVEIKRVAIERFGVAAAADAVLDPLRPLAPRCVPISFVPDVLRDVRDRGFKDVGLILERWADARRPAVAELRPGYVLCNVRKLPRRGELRVPGVRLAVYDVTDPVRAAAYLERGVDLVETFAIGEMLEHVR